MNELLIIWALKKMRVDQEWNNKTKHSKVDLLFHTAKIGYIKIYNYQTQKLSCGLTPAFNTELRLVVAEPGHTYITNDIVKIIWQGGSEGTFITSDGTVYAFQFSEMTYPKFINEIKNLL